MSKTILVTGSAGFIGFHLSKFLLEKDFQVIGFDNFNNYYGVQIKEDRNKILEEFKNFKLYRADLVDRGAVQKVFAENKIDQVCHLAAQAGVRYSLEHPEVYIQSNLVGFFNLIDEAQKQKVENFVYASSSSVYGKNKKIPFSVKDPVDNPISLYAATKKSDELIAHVYSHLYDLPTTGLRFFTVYGPYGRPDMALFKFTKAILEDKPIEVYNFGKMQRDFTYIDDIVQGVYASLTKPFEYEIFNLGNHQPVELEHFISCVEKELGKKAEKNYLPLQPGDVPATYADIIETQEKLGWQPTTNIEEGIKKFIEWYRQYFKV
jgi:UDP-glucuronate 4-epimerase